MHPVSSLSGREWDDRSYAISTSLRRIGEEAVDVIEERSGNFRLRSFRRPRSSHNFANEIFPLVPFNFHNSFTGCSRRKTPRKFGDAFRPGSRILVLEKFLRREGNQEGQVVRSFAGFASRPRT